MLNLIQQAINNKTSFLAIKPVGTEDVMFFQPDIAGRDAEILSHDNKLLHFSKTDISQLSDIQNNSNTFSRSKDTSKDDYTISFKKALNAIKSGEVDKVIISRIKTIQFNRFQLAQLFEALCAQYNAAMVHVLCLGDTIWMGASPELLSRIENDTCTCTSLAGTVEAKLGEWSEKEKIEQQIVTDYICSCVSRHGTLTSVKGPEDKIAGSVKHLYSVITGKIDHYSLFLEDLHPTPAIAGFPKQNALDLIHRIENHKRELYTGYIRFTYKSKDLSYVNLRCFKHIDDTAYLFLGGGLTKDSDLEKEWQETELKAETLVHVMKKL